MIRVAIDAEHTRHSRAGIARYATSLLHALSRRGDVDAFEIGGGEIVPRGTVRKKLLTLNQDLLWYPFRARAKAESMGAQVYHSPLPRGPFKSGSIPFVVTVHDLVPLLWPQTMRGWNKMYMRLTLKRLAQNADLIFTPSASTANDVNRLLGISPGKIRIVPNGVDPLFFESVSLQDGVPPYVLFVGTPEPRKNLRRLVEAVAHLRKTGLGYRLTLVGDGGWGKMSELPDFVDCRGRVSDRELHSLYAQASVTVLPSLHEGFGIPAVEAMAAGSPVVVARAGALPEVAGNAAVYVDPFSPTDIADGITKALNDRQRLIELGRIRAQEFSWDNAAEITARAYRELV